MSYLSQFTQQTSYTTAFQSNDNIQVGDVVTIGASDGLAYAAYDPFVGGTNNAHPLTQALSFSGMTALLYGQNISFTPTGYTLNQPSGGYYQTVMQAQITNGNLVSVFNSSNNIYFQITDLLGNVIVGPINVASTVSSLPAYVAALTNGNFVVTYINSASNYPSFAIYNSAGVLQAGPTIITSTSSNLGVTVCGLTGGGFAVTFGGASNVVNYAVYSNTGTVVLATSSALGGNAPYSTNWFSDNIIALTGGGFAICSVVGISGNPAVTVFNAAGSILATQYPKVFTTTNSYFCYIAPLANGNVAFATHYTINSSTLDNIDIAVISGTTGAYVVPPTNIHRGGYSSGTTGQYFFAKMVSAGNNFGIISVDGGYSGASTAATFCIMVNSTGKILGQYIINEFFNWVTATPNFDGSINFYGQPTSSTAGNIYGVKMSSTGQVLSPLYSALIVSSYATCLSCTTLPYSNTASGGPGSLSILIPQSSAFTNAYLFYNSQQLIPIGVATTAAAAGSYPTIQTAGTATTRLSFKSPLQINAQQIGGQKMGIIGNSATLLGNIPSTTAMRSIN
jgi:hypothetical protein